MTREQILKHKDRLDKIDALSERILNVVFAVSGGAFALVFSQTLSIIGA